jgi:hypothetical protein
MKHRRRRWWFALLEGLGEICFIRLAHFSGRVGLLAQDVCQESNPEYPESAGSGFFIQRREGCGKRGSAAIC